METKDESSTSNHQAQVVVRKKGVIEGQFNAPSGTYYSCCLLQNRALVFANVTEQCLYTVTPDLNLKSKFQFQGNEGVRHVTSIDDCRVAVTNPRTATLSIVNVGENKCEKKIPTKQAIGGIAYSNGFIIFCFPLSGIFRVNLNGIPSYNAEIMFSDTSLSEHSTVVVSGNQICFTSQQKQAIMVLDSKFNILFQVQNRSFYDISGITFNANMNIYATGVDTNNLMAISFDGTSCDQLLDEDDGLKCPTAVVYDNAADNLIVLEKGGRIFTFLIK